MMTMHNYKNAEQRTKTRIKAIGIVTLLYGLAYHDIRPQFLVNSFFSIAKYVWKNDSDARKDAIEYAVCKLIE